MNGSNKVIRGATLVVVFAALLPTDLGADSDLAVTCGPRFAVYDRLVSDTRTLHVVPWTETGELRVAGSVAMPADQPHRWLIHGPHVVVRAWNDVRVFRVGEDYVPRLIFSARIDQERSSVGGPVDIEMIGPVARVYGVGRVLEIDLDACATSCSAREVAFSEPPARRIVGRLCSVGRGDLIFGETTATTQAPGVTFHDVFLTRRRADWSDPLPGPNPFQPESMLYLGTRIETGH